MNLELKIPPPIVGLICALTIWALGRTVSTWNIDFAGREEIALCLFVIGVAIDVLALLKFKQKRTTINPMNPDESKELVTTGVFNFTRNPMYLGLLIILSAWTFYVGNLLSSVVLVFFIYYITKFQILPEERVMHEKFDESFVEYTHRVRRWV